MMNTHCAPLTRGVWPGLLLEDHAAPFGGTLGVTGGALPVTWRWVLVAWARAIPQEVTEGSALETGACGSVAAVCVPDVCVLWMRLKNLKSHLPGFLPGVHRRDLESAPWSSGRDGGEWV